MSADGLIDPAEFPVRASGINTEPIYAAATRCRTLGSAVSSNTGDMKASWAGLEASYVAPEQEKVLGLVPPLSVKASQVEQVCLSMAVALDIYAQTLDGIKPRLADLERRAQEFHDRVKDGVQTSVVGELPDWMWVVSKEVKLVEILTAGAVTVPWYQHGPTTVENDALVGELNTLINEVIQAGSDCMEYMKGQGVPLPEPDTSAGTEGDSSNDLPAWGYQREEDRNCIEQVSKGGEDVVTGIGTGVGMLFLGYNPETGGFRDGSSALSTWGNLLDLIGALVFTPVYSVVDQTCDMLEGLGVDTGGFGSFFDDRADVLPKALCSLLSIDYTALKEGDVEGGFSAWTSEPWRAGTSTLLNVGTFFIPGAGVVGGGVKAASTSAKVMSAVRTVAEFVAPGGSWVVKTVEGTVQGSRILATGGKFGEAINGFKSVMGFNARSGAMANVARSLPDPPFNLPKTPQGLPEMNPNSVTPRSSLPETPSQSVRPTDVPSRGSGNGLDDVSVADRSRLPVEPSDGPGNRLDDASRLDRESWLHQDVPVEPSASERAQGARVTEPTVPGRADIAGTYSQAQVPAEGRPGGVGDRGGSPAVSDRNGGPSGSSGQNSGWVVDNSPTPPHFEAIELQRWDALSQVDRVEALQRLENYAADVQGRPVRTVLLDPSLPAGTRGQFARDQFLRVNPDLVAPGTPPFQAMDTVLHEGRHALQHDALRGQASHGESAATAQGWYDNYWAYNNNPDRFYEYRFQPVEADAFGFADQGVQAFIQQSRDAQSMVHAAWDRFSERSGTRYLENWAARDLGPDFRAQISNDISARANAARAGTVVPTPSGRSQLHDLSASQNTLSAHRQPPRSYDPRDGFAGPPRSGSTVSGGTPGGPGETLAGGRPSGGDLASGRGSSDSPALGGENLVADSRVGEAPREPTVADREQAVSRALREGVPLEPSVPGWDRRLPEHERFRYDLVWDQAAGEFRAVRPSAGEPTSAVLAEFPRPATVGDPVGVAAPVNTGRGTAPPAVRVTASGEQVLHNGRSMKADTCYDIAGRGRFYTGADGRVVRVELTSEAGRALHPDAQRGRLLPDAEYVQGNTVYTTNSEGIAYLTDVRGQALDGGVRSGSVQRAVGAEGMTELNYPGERYQGGHKNGTQTGGSPDGINNTPMLEEINNARSEFKHPPRVPGPDGPDGRPIWNFGDVEESLARYQRDNPRAVVDRQIEEIYDYSVSREVPVEIVSRYRINNGPWVENRFDNVPEYDPGNRPQNPDGSRMSGAEYAEWRRLNAESSHLYEVGPGDSAQLAREQRDALRQALREAVETVGTSR